MSEVTVTLRPEEVTELMVAASQVEEGSLDHALLTDDGGTTIALYRESGDLEPLTRQVDWWLGPVLLLAGVLVAVGAFTVVRGLVRLLF